MALYAAYSTQQTPTHIVIGCVGYGPGQEGKGDKWSNEAFIHGVQAVDPSGKTVIVNRGWGGTMPAIRVIQEAGKAGPVVVDLYGYSRGAITAIEIAERLNTMGIQVSLLMTIDPVTLTGNSGSIDVPSNVAWAVNHYQNGQRVDLMDFPGTQMTAAPNVLNIFYSDTSIPVGRYEYRVQHQNMPSIVFGDSVVMGGGSP